MATKFEQNISKPLHIENTVRDLAKEDLKLSRSFYTYRDMMTDSQIAGGVSLIQGLINKLDYSLHIDKEATEKAKALTAALNQSLNNMTYSKQQFINYILSELHYGHSIFEMVFKRVEGKMVFSNFSPIHPINVKKYIYNGGKLVSLTLDTPDNDGLLIQESKAEKDLAGDKVLMFKLNADLDHPLGRSMLERVYVDWKSKLIASEYELIGIAKNLSGVVKIEAPIEYLQDWYNNPTSDNARYIDSLLEQAELLHGGKSSVLMTSSDVTQTNSKLFDVTQFGADNTSSSTIDIDKTITRYNNNILTSLYTDILALGQAGGGSYSLGDSKTNLLGLFVESVLSGIKSTFSIAVKQAFALNSVDTKYLPELVFDDVDEKDIDKFSRAWQRLVQAGAVTADENLEAYLRKQMSAPDVDYSKKLQTKPVADTVDRLEEDKQG